MAKVIKYSNISHGTVKLITIIITKKKLLEKFPTDHRQKLIY